MPIITIESGRLSIEQKRELIHCLTETASEITKIPKRFFVLTIKELDDENLGFAGETVAELKNK